MEAAGQGGIPTAFIVGKTGQIEWIGHPMQMDKPLEEIVADEWDRDTFAKKFAIEQKAGLAMSSIMRLVRDEKADEALKSLDSFLENDSEGVDRRTISRMKSMRKSIAMEVGGEVAVAAFAAMLEEAGDNQRMVSRLTRRVISQKKDGKEIDDKILKAACEAAEKSVAVAEEAGKDELTAQAMDTHANLLYLCGKLEDAIDVQKKAVALSDNKKLAKFLEELEEELKDNQG
jgi:tetratricopeptide (TPR) repeat protein